MQIIEDEFNNKIDLEKAFKTHWAMPYAIIECQQNGHNLKECYGNYPMIFIDTVEKEIKLDSNIFDPSLSGDNRRDLAKIRIKKLQQIIEHD